jgi:aryl-alcohol dehydrogenase-like predicted oxidoreductase
VAEQLGVIPYFGLASGFLTGKYRSKADFGKSPRGASMEKYLDARGVRILDALDAMAAAHRAQPAEVALAWIMRQPAITAPIASATSAEQLDSLVRATTLSLSEADIKVLNAASA